MSAQQKVTVEIGGSIAGSLGKSLKAAQTQVSSFGRNVDRAVGDSMKSAKASIKDLLGSGLYQLSAGASVAFGAITTGLFKLGTSFDQAFDTIRIGTGATGKALDGLKNDFREVFRSTPADMQTVGQAIADLNTRTGLTGKPLQLLTRQMVNLEQLGQGLAQENIPTLTRVLGDWGVSADDTGSSMDKLFRASQATGPSMSQLGESMVKFGAPLRQMGFGFEEAAAMVGKFEKEGVNTELVMGSLRISLGNMAKAGEKDIPKAFRASLKAIKETRNASAATTMAIQLFGKKAGPDMAAAIREGRFEIDALVRQIKSGKDTINSVAFETADASEKFKIIRNDLAVALEPMANNVFGALGETLDKLMPTIKAVTNEIAYFAKTNPQATTTILGLTVGLLGLVAVAPMIAGVIGVIGAIGGAAVIGPIAAVVAAVVGFGLAFKTAYDKVAWFRDAVNTVFSGWGSLIGGVIDTIKGGWSIIVGIFTGDTQKISQGFAQMKHGIGRIFKGILGIAQGAWAGIVGAATATWNNITTGLGNAVKMGQLFIGLLVKKIWERWTGVINFIKEAPGKLKEVGSKVIEAIINGLKSKVGELFGWIRGTWGQVTNFFSGADSGEPPQPPARTPSGNPRAGTYRGGQRAGRRALGGPVRAGFPYIVGEKRRELFVPGMDGAIVPRVARPVTAAALAGLLAAPLPAAAAGGGVTIHAPVTINGAGGDAMEIRRQVELAFMDIQREIESSHRVLLND